MFAEFICGECNKMLAEIRQTILEAETKDDVIDITLAMIGLQVPILYEPRYTDFGYESCFMCNEYLQIRILHRE